MRYDSFFKQNHESNLEQMFKMLPGRKWYERGQRETFQALYFIQ